MVIGEERSVIDHYDSSLNSIKKRKIHSEGFFFPYLNIDRRSFVIKHFGTRSAQFKEKTQFLRSNAQAMHFGTKCAIYAALETLVAYKNN